nr:TniQ family protein [uncultured Albidiferax sp.]
MIPLYPEGTTLASIVRITMLVQQCELGLKISTRVFHGWGIGEIAQRCLPPSEDLRTALRRYSAAPILLALRQEEHAAKLEETLLQGLRPKTGPHRVLPVSSTVRRCPECVDEDLRDVGVACARVLHQVIGVAHCPSHNIPLQQACSKCGQEFEELTISSGRIVSTILDLKHCPACGCTSGVNLTLPKADMYRLFVDLLVGAFKGNAWLLQPKIRTHLVEAAAECSAKEGTAVTAAFAAEWGTDSFDDAAAVCGANPGILKRALLGMDLNSNPTAAVMSIAFALSFLAKRQIFYGGKFCELDGANGNSTPVDDTLEDRLRCAGKIHGVPSALIERLAEGSGGTNLWARSDTVRFLLDSLSDADKRQLDRRQAAARAVHELRFDDDSRRRSNNRIAVLYLVRKARYTELIVARHSDFCKSMFVNDSEWLKEVAPSLYQATINVYPNLRPIALAMHTVTNINPSGIAVDKTEKRPGKILETSAFKPAHVEVTS